MRTGNPSHWTMSPRNARSWEMADGEGGRWTILPLSDTSFFALLRLDAAEELVLDQSLTAFMDQREIGFALCRNAAEAKVLGTLLAGSNGDIREAESLLGRIGFEQVSQHYGRRWELKTLDAVVSLFTKSDHDDRDVTLNTVTFDEDGIESPLGIFHGQRNSPIGENGTALHAAAAFIALLRKSNHLLTPLSETDWQAFAEGRTIAKLPFTRLNPAIAERFVISCLLDRSQHDGAAYWHVVDTARPLGRNGPLEHLNGEVLAAVEGFLGPDGDAAPDLAALINRDRTLQHMLLAATMGNEDALLLAEGASVPAARLN